MKRSRLLVNKPYLIVALLLLYQTPLMAQEGQSTNSADTDPAPPAAAAAAVSMSELLDMFNKLQSQLDDQKQQLLEQQKLIATLQGVATTELTEEMDKNTKQAQQIEEEFGPGDGNRTRATCLEGRSSTTELPPHSRI